MYNKRQLKFLDAVKRGCPNLDSDQGIYFARELEQIDRTVYEVKLPPLEAEMLLPRRQSVPLGINTHTFRLFDGKGEAIPSSGSEDAVPMVDISADESSEKLQSWALGYGWTLEELDTARATGMPLDSMRAERVRRGLGEKLNTMALLGYSKKGIKGLFNLSNTLTYSTPATGASSGTSFESKTAPLCLIDLTGMVDAIPNSTLDVEGGANKPMTMLLPKSKMRVLSTKFFDNTTDDVISRFKRIRPNITLMGANYLDTAGGSSATRAVVYDPQMVEWLVCLPFQQMPVEQKGFKFAIPCRARGGGVFTRYPKSVLYADAI